MLTSDSYVISEHPDPVLLRSDVRRWLVDLVLLCKKFLQLRLSRWEHLPRVRIADNPNGSFEDDFR